MSERVTPAEVCALLQMPREEFRRLTDDYTEGLTLRHVLAMKVTASLLPMVNRDVAERTGVTAGRDAKIGADRLLVIAQHDGDTAACWRRADSDFRASVPFLAVPADAWFASLTEFLHEHRRAAERPN
jgi:hypothetical protein